MLSLSPALLTRSFHPMGQKSLCFLPNLALDSSLGSVRRSRSPAIGAVMDAEAAAAAPPEQPVVESLVVVHNVAKRHNVGTMARSATAFGVSEIVLVGRRDYNAFGSHGSTSHLRFRHFHSLSHARLYLKALTFFFPYEI